MRPEPGVGESGERVLHPRTQAQRLAHLQEAAGQTVWLEWGLGVGQESKRQAQGTQG